MRSLTYCTIGLSLLFAAAEARAADPEARLLTANGEGKVELTPDAARIHLGVQTEEKTLAAARDTNEKAVRRVLQQVMQLKIPKLLMKTDEEQVDLIKESNPPSGKLARIIGHRVFTAITIRVNDASPTGLSQKASRVIDQALAGGANHLQGVTFLRLDSRGAYNQALRAAIDDAKLNAAIMAQQAKVNLLRLRTLTPSWGSHYPELSYGAGGHGGWQYGNVMQVANVSGSGSGTVVAAGSFVVKASVTAVFEMK
jgi:uncharacterized protein